MAKSTGKKVDIAKIAEQYLSRMKGEPDAMRLLMNLLADNLTDLNKLKEQIIKQEFSSSIAKPRADKISIIQHLSESYGLSKGTVEEIIKGV